MADWAAMVEARDAEIQRLKRDLRISEAKVGGAALYVDRVNAKVAMLENVVDVYDGIHGERDRYRLAWLSARRRAADEANFGMEALDLERARQASFVAELQPLVRARMEELRRLRQFKAEVEARDIRESTHAPRLECAGTEEDGGTVWQLLCHDTDGSDVYVAPVGTPAPKVL